MSPQTSAFYSLIIGGIVAGGFYLSRKYIGTKGKANSPHEYGRKWLAWGVAGSFMGGMLQVASHGIGFAIGMFFSALIGLGPLSYALGWGYGRFLKFRGDDPTENEASEISDREAAFLEEARIAALDAGNASPSTPPQPSAKPLTPSQSISIDEDAIYTSIAVELETGATDKALWTRLFAQCDGDENKTKAAYIKHRADKLKQGALVAQAAESKVQTVAPPANQSIAAKQPVAVKMAPPQEPKPQPESWAHELADLEIQNKKLDLALWKELISAHNGDGTAAKIAYIHKRAELLLTNQASLSTSETKPVRSATLSSSEIKPEQTSTETSSPSTSEATTFGTETHNIGNVAHSTFSPTKIILLLLLAVIVVTIILTSTNSNNIKPYSDYSETGFVRIDKYFEQLSHVDTSICLELAQKENVDGMYCVFQRLKDTDPNKAIEYLRRAAEKGHPLAQNDLGASYQLKNANKYGLLSDERTSYFWKLKAAESGVPTAEVSIGWEYMTANSAVSIDYSEAMKWNVAAFEHGDGEGAANIGMLYEKGWGVPRDYTKAAEWYRKAIPMRGAYSGQADVRLGYLHQNGLGVQRNTDEAARLYRRVLNDLKDPIANNRKFASEYLELITSNTSIQSTTESNAQSENDINLHANSRSWIEISDDTKKVLFSGEVPTGNNLSLNGLPPFDITIGNSPNVQLTYRGRSVDLAPYTRSEVARLKLE